MKTNFTAVKKAEAIKHFLVTLLIALLVTSTGCRTSSGLAGINSPSSHLDDLPAGVRKALVSCVQSKPGDHRQVAVAELFEILDEWARKSTGPNVRENVDLLSSVVAVQLQFESATNQCERAKAAEDFIRFLNIAMALKGWHSGDLAQLKDTVDETQRARDQALFQMLFEAPCIKNRENYAKSIEALHDMSRLCRSFAKAEYWNTTEQEGWDQAAREFDNLCLKYVSEFDATLAAIRVANENEQKFFVNTAAVTDCSVARKIETVQDDKTLNWSILAHFRDDPRAFAMSLGLLDRVLQEKRVDYATKLGAAALRSECEGRLGRRGHEIYAWMGEIPSYDTLPNYPNLSEDKLRELAEAQWRENGKPLPLFQETTDMAQGPVSPTTVPAKGN